MVSIKRGVVKTALAERGESALQTEAGSACGYCIHLVKGTFHLHLLQGHGAGRNLQDHLCPG